MNFVKYEHSICRDQFGHSPGNCPCTDPNCAGFDPDIEAADIDPQGWDDSLYPVNDSDIARERAFQC